MDSKGFAPLIAVILLAVVAIAGAAGYFFWRKSMVSQPAVQQGNSSVIDTSDWKTYANQQYGFEFKYPAAWGAPIEGSGTVSFASPDPNADIPVNWLSIGISAANGEMIDQLISDENQPGISVSDVQRTTLGGADARKFLMHREGGFANYGLLGARGNYVYEIDYGNWFWGSAVPSSTVQSEEVLSTFQFLTSTSTVGISGWKTYANQQYGFSFNFPPDWEISTNGLQNTLGSTSSAPFIVLGHPLSGMATYALYLFIFSNPQNLSSEGYVQDVLAKDRQADNVAEQNGDAPDRTPHFDKQYGVTVNNYNGYELYNVFEYDRGGEEIYLAHNGEAVEFDFPVAEANPNLSSPQKNNALAHQIINTLIFK